MIFIRVLNGNNPRLIFVRFLADQLYDPLYMIRIVLDPSKSVEDFVQDPSRSRTIFQGPHLQEVGKFFARLFKILDGHN